MKKILTVLVTCLAIGSSAMAAQDDNVRIYDTNTVSAFINKNIEILDSNWNKARKCSEARENQKIMDGIYMNTDEANAKRIAESRRMINNYCR